MILGIAGVAILAGLQLSVIASDIHRKQTSDGAYVRGYAEAIEKYLNTTGNYVKCAGANAYSPAAVGYTVPAGHSAQQAAAEPLAGDGSVAGGTCPGAGPGRPTAPAVRSAARTAGPPRRSPSWCAAPAKRGRHATERAPAGAPPAGGRLHPARADHHRHHHRHHRRGAGGRGHQLPQDDDRHPVAAHRVARRAVRRGVLAARRLQHRRPWLGRGDEVVPPPAVGRRHPGLQPACWHPRRDAGLERVHLVRLDRTCRPRSRCPTSPSPTPAGSTCSASGAPGRRETHPFEVMHSLDTLPTVSCNTACTGTGPNVPTVVELQLSVLRPGRPRHHPLRGHPRR